MIGNRTSLLYGSTLGELLCTAYFFWLSDLFRPQSPAKFITVVLIAVPTTSMDDLVVKVHDSNSRPSNGADVYNIFSEHCGEMLIFPISDTRPSSF